MDVIRASWWYFHRAEPKRGCATLPEAIPLERLVISIRLYKVLFRDELIESETLVGKTVLWDDFSRIKRYSSDASTLALYREEFSDAVSDVSVPQEQHAAIIESIFRAIDTAVSIQIPVVVAVWDVTAINSLGRDRDESNCTAAAGQSSIQSLELLQLRESELQQAILRTPSCPICLNDFAQEEGQSSRITALPCKHYFHVNCMIQWLRRNRSCPMCRYPLPTDTQQA